MRRELVASGHTFRGHSDTEVRLEACEDWGIDTAIARSIGMFAMAIYDREVRVLTFARDRFGKKPLYFGTYGDCLIFGSQPRVFWPHPLFKPELDGQSFSSYIRFGYVPPSASSRYASRSRRAQSCNSGPMVT
jgi:asparagine synthase (glutamine-hydrolysing)